MLKINIEKVIVTLGTLIFYMVFPFYWWWLILDKIPPSECPKTKKSVPSEAKRTAL